MRPVGGEWHSALVNYGDDLSFLKAECGVAVTAYRVELAYPLDGVSPNSRYGLCSDCGAVRLLKEEL